MGPHRRGMIPLINLTSFLCIGLFFPFWFWFVLGQAKYWSYVVSLFSHQVCVMYYGAVIRGCCVQWDWIGNASKRVVFPRE